MTTSETDSTDGRTDLDHANEQVDVPFDEVAKLGEQNDRLRLAVEQATGWTEWRAIYLPGDEEPVVQFLYDGFGRRWEHLFVNETDSDGQLATVSRWTPQRHVFGQWRGNPLAPARETWEYIVRYAPLFDTPCTG